MSLQTATIPQAFPLDTIGPAVDKITLPDQSFDPVSDWAQTYGVYTTPAGASRLGELRLQRVARADDHVLLDMTWQKKLMGGTQKIAAKIHFPADSPLASPTDWSFQAEVVNDQGHVLEDTCLTKSLRVRDGVLVVRDGTGTHSVKLQADYALNWALFESVGRLPRQPFPAKHFTLIDHFDQVKPGHILEYRTTTEVTINGRAHALHAFNQLGRGVVPWVWWVDNQGCLLVAVSGMEVYVREA